MPWHNLDGKIVMISGATGLIGRTLTDLLLAYAQSTARPPHILALVRNQEKARAFWDETPNLTLLSWTADQPLEYSGNVDYIIHCASQTSSKGFIQQPVDTIRTAIMGTETLLQLAAKKKSAGFLYLSSMEVYGTPQTDMRITEDFVGTLDPLKVRNCYPEAKRMCESLCVSYSSQFGVPASIARLTQTFGPGVQADDNRVFAEFARCAMAKKDIVLHTKGETKRSYVYTADAARALLTVLLRGTSAEAYNIANAKTYCTIYEMACMVADKIAKGSIQVRCELTDAEKLGYAPVLRMNLDTEKLLQLGWRPYCDLEEMYRRMMGSMRQEKLD
ncbi:MAG: NAD-dependent epimerase/dehydratase family protein [Ruminococcaceae bacterium]|nr:NAD-dependent epimerase/dehydratase family protein [Oscillospiraceae bacterium]